MSDERCQCWLSGRQCVLPRHHDASMNATPHDFGGVVAEESIETFIAQWFTQGGATQFGTLDFDGRAPANADEFVSCVLTRVRGLFIRYIRHVEASEGVTFLEDGNRQASYGDPPPVFTDDEWKALQELAIQACPPRF